jgi:hypothetical protein
MKSETDRQLTAGDNSGKYFIALTVNIEDMQEGAQYDIADALNAESFTFDNIKDKARFKIQMIVKGKPDISKLRGYKLSMLKITKLERGRE